MQKLLQLDSLVVLYDAWVGLIIMQDWLRPPPISVVHPAAAMVEWQYFAIPALCVVVILLFLVLLVALLLCLRKREMLCFKSRRRKRARGGDEETRFTNIYSKEEERRPMGLKRRRQHFADPFANRFSDPFFMDQGLENFDISQWDNPLFDAKGAREREAAITIQTWWRMVR